MPPLGKLGWKHRSMKGIRHLIGTEACDVLLYQRKKDMRKLVESNKFPWIGFSQSDARYRFGDALRLALFRSLPTLLVHVFYTPLCTLRFTYLYGTLYEAKSTGIPTKHKSTMPFTFVQTG